MAVPILIGDPFQKRIRRSNRAGENRWFGCFRCECGHEFETAVAQVRSGKTTSCGCKSSKKRIGTLTKTHGMSGTRTYDIWCGMHKRCIDPKSNKYHLYGGRGIKVCDRWTDFEAFLADMGEAPADMTLDRFPDGDGDYRPGNCRWATKTEQARNRKGNVLITIDGDTKTLAEWAESSANSYKVIHRRIKRGWTPREAIFGRPT